MFYPVVIHESQEAGNQDGERATPPPGCFFSLVPSLFFTTPPNRTGDCMKLGDHSPKHTVTLC